MRHLAASEGWVGHADDLPRAIFGEGRVIKAAAVIRARPRNQRGTRTGSAIEAGDWAIIAYGWTEPPPAMMPSGLNQMWKPYMH